MEIKIWTGAVAALRSPLVALPVSTFPTRDPVVVAAGDALGGQLRQLARDEGFKGQQGKMLQVTPLGQLGAARLVVFGLGRSTALGAEQVRTYAHRVGRLARELGLASFALVAPPPASRAPLRDLIQWLTEGALSGVYRYDRYQTQQGKPKKEPKHCVVALCQEHGPWPKGAVEEAQRGASWGTINAQSVAWACDLVNAPANELSPVALAEQARELARPPRLTVEVWLGEELQAQRLNLLEAVGRGSRIPPCLVHLTYRPSDRVRGRIVLVGKGVTFDSGGLSLKPAKGLVEMKSDMAGAATVLGALKAAELHDLPYEIHGLVPIAENMPGGAASRPGDVVTTRAGKTVEIQNTDAEGRLILADALSLAQDLSPDLVVDFATLTGACLVALGPYRAGLFASNEKWARRYLEAAARAGESVWRLPLAAELQDSLKSSVADLRNIGGSWGGAITAALFLMEFVGKTPWLHLDIAGPAFLEEPHGFLPRGGTGYGILSLLELLRSESGREIS